MVERIFVYQCSLGCAGLGYLAGPTIGTLLFKVFNGNKNKSMELMDKRSVDTLDRSLFNKVSEFRLWQILRPHQVETSRSFLPEHQREFGVAFV